jgi:hypothetical protein
MGQRRGSPERLSRLQAAILAVVAEGEWLGEGGAYGWWEVCRHVRRLQVTTAPAKSLERSMRNLCAKGLIEPIPYFSGEAALGHLWGLSDTGRALIRTRGLLPPHLLAESHPIRIDVS